MPPDLRELFHVPKFMRNIFIGLTTFFCTLLTIHIISLGIHFRFRYVALPNALELYNTSWFGDSIALRDARGRTVVEPQVMEIVWNDRYIMGRQLLGYGSVFGQLSREFVYRIGDDAAVFESAATKKEFLALIKESRLEYTKRVGPNTFTNIDTTFWGLINDPRYRRAWYQ
jgi:hypothetical protein